MSALGLLCDKYRIQSQQPPLSFGCSRNLFFSRDRLNRTQIVAVAQQHVRARKRVSSDKLSHPLVGVNQQEVDKNCPGVAARFTQPNSDTGHLSTGEPKLAENGDNSTCVVPHQAFGSQQKLLDKYSDDDLGISVIIKRISPRVRGLVLLNALVVMVATNWVVLKDVGSHFDPFMFASLRFSVAALALSPFLLQAKHSTISAGVELGLYTAAGYLAQSQGLLTTEASRASFLSTFTVIVVPFLAGLNGHGVRPQMWAAAVAALVGVSLLEQSGAEPGMGDLWSVVSAIAFGIQIFRTEHYSRILGRKQIIPLMSIVLTTTAVLATLTAGIEPDVLHKASAMVAYIPWREVLYTGLLTTDVALLLEFVALQDVTSTEAAITYTLEPVLGAGLAFAVLGERWGPTGWLGATLIVGSCLGMQLWGEEHKN